MVASAPFHDLAPIGQVGRYDVLGRLAVGGMAEVFLARERGPEQASRTVVVKQVLPHVAGDPHREEMFTQEATLCLQLRHPHICPIYEFGEQGGRFYIAMEWVPGVPLNELMELARPRQLPVDVAVSIASDIAGALHHAHTATDEHGRPLGVVHRDVTPENIVISWEGIPKLIDFGVAKAVTQKHKTQSGALKGKLAYIPPEQYKGESVDGRGDVFSLGVCLYETLAGESLYERASEYETVAAIMLDPHVPSLRKIRQDVPPELDAIVARALAKDRDARFATADAFQEALQRFLAQRRHIVRASEVTSLLEELCGGGFRQPPDLERSGIVVGASQSLRAANDEGLEDPHRFALEAELEQVEGGFAAASRRKRWLVVATAVFIVLGIFGLAAYVIDTSDPPPDRPEQPTATEPPESQR